MNHEHRAGFWIEAALIAGLIAVVIFAGFTTLAHGPM